MQEGSRRGREGKKREGRAKNECEKRENEEEGSLIRSSRYAGYLLLMTCVVLEQA